MADQIVLRYEGEVPTGMRIVSREDGDSIEGTPTVAGEVSSGRWIVKRKTKDGEVEGWVPQDAS